MQVLEFILKKTLFTRTIYEKIPSSVKILKRKENIVVFLRRGVQWNQTIKKFNPLLQSKVKRIVIKRLNKLIQVKTFFLHKKKQIQWKKLGNL